MKHLQIVILITWAFISSANAEGRIHLFILSGQSNMAKLDPRESFTPAVEAAFGRKNVIVVKDAQNGQLIKRWYKKWPEVSPKPARNAPQASQSKEGGDGSEKCGDLYDRLMAKVNKAIAGKTPDTVTFVWMQGESDAKQGNDAVYRECLLGLIKQLSEDLKRDDINYVIGRLSQFTKTDSWEGVRKVQVEVAGESRYGAWVDTDDVEIEGIHYTKAGYKDLGNRFADKAIDLIKIRTGK